MHISQGTFPDLVPNPPRSDAPSAYLPSPEVLWSHATTLAAWSTEQLLPGHTYRRDETGVRYEDVGNGWWALSWVEGGRAVLYGIDNDCSETLGLAPPVDLLADGPSWLPWQWLGELIAGDEGLGFVYWWADGVWGRAPYPVEVHDDGVRSMVPADDSQVRQVCADLVDDGADPADVRSKEAAHRRAAAGSDEDRPVLPTGHGEPADRRVPCWLPEQHAAVLAVAMKAAAELERPVPDGTAELEQLVAWVRHNGTWQEGCSEFAAAFADAGDAEYGRGDAGFLDVLGRRLFGEAVPLLAALRDAEADDERGRWLYVRVTVTDDGSTVERAYDCLPDWWPARRGILAALPTTVRLEMARRTPSWRPDWSLLLEEDIHHDGAPARLCRVELGLPMVQGRARPS